MWSLTIIQRLQPLQYAHTLFIHKKLKTFFCQNSHFVDYIIITSFNMEAPHILTRCGNARPRTRRGWPLPQLAMRCHIKSYSIHELQARLVTRAGSPLPHPASYIVSSWCQIQNFLWDGEHITMFNSCRMETHQPNLPKVVLVKQLCRLIYLPAANIL